MDFKGPHRGSCKQPDFAIRSLNLTLPNLVIETAFAQGEEDLRRKVQLWLEGSHEVLQVVIVIKMRESAITMAGQGSESSMSDSDHSEDGRPAAPVLVPDDDLLVGPIEITIELWRWRDDVGVYLDYQLVGMLPKS